MKFLKSNFLFLLPLVLGMAIMASCGKDDDGGGPSTGDTVIASYQFAISETNFLEVTFSNFSQNATTYSWNFGDGNTSTEENPVHTFSAGGDYDVVLTASNATDTKSVTKTITITDPNTAIKALTGDVSKVWKLSRNIAEEEYPAQVGPADQSQIWWALGLNEEIGVRPCLMEEEYIFGVDGSYTYDSKGLTWGEGGVFEESLIGMCLDNSVSSNMVGPNGEDLSAWGSGSYTFDYNTSTGTLTLNGLGAHVGIAKVGSDAEYFVPQNSVTYRVVSIETDGPVDKLVLETDLVTAGGYWRFFLVSYDNPADEPDLPGAAPTVGFTSEIDGSTVTFTNNSGGADSYSWDFGDGGSSTQENPVHTYAADGSYTVTLTATNANGSNMISANVVIAANSVFSATTINGDGTKTWKLNPAANALAVGPAPGSGEWFATSLDDVTARACTFDDEYTFDNGGDFAYVSNGDVWAEAYMGIDPPGCVDESSLPADAAAWGAGSHTYTVTEDAGTFFVTVTGTGAFIGLPKAFNGGEYAAGPPAANGSVTYRVLSYVNTGSSEILVLTIDISENQVGGAFWTFTLISQ